jgi:hypothetical protein
LLIGLFGDLDDHVDTGILSYAERPSYPVLSVSHPWLSLRHPFQFSPMSIFR